MRRTPGTQPRRWSGCATASVFPESTAFAFETAQSSCGYDGVEVMVWTDPVSQDPHALRRLSDTATACRSSPCTPLPGDHAAGMVGPTRGSSCAAPSSRPEMLGAQTVVVHPPFRWQREYSRRFHAGLDARWPRRRRCGSPWRTCSRCGCAAEKCPRTRRPGTWQPTQSRTGPTRSTSPTRRYRSPTCSPCWTCMGKRMAHLHVGDGTGIGRDEHLVPGRGTQPCAAVLERITGLGLRRPCHCRGEHSPGGGPDRPRVRPGRGLAFCRLHLVAPPSPTGSPSPDDHCPSGGGRDGRLRSGRSMRIPRSVAAQECRCRRNQRCLVSEPVGSGPTTTGRSCGSPGLGAARDEERGTTGEVEQLCRSPGSAAHAAGGQDRPIGQFACA